MILTKEYTLTFPLKVLLERERNKTAWWEDSDISSQIIMRVSSLHKDARNWWPIKKGDRCVEKRIKAKC